MNGERAQLIALASYGNVFLHATGPARDILLSNTTFQYVGDVSFARYAHRDAKRGVPVPGPGTIGWFEDLKSRGARRLACVAFAGEGPEHSERYDVAFVGGVRAAVQAVYRDFFELWYPFWSPAAHPDNPSRPWSVEYRCLTRQSSSEPPAIPLQQVATTLKLAVERALRFCVRQEAEKAEVACWSTVFSSALEALHSPSPTIPFHPDLLPDVGFSPLARQVIACAAHSDVFAGMGSWNDLEVSTPTAQEEYDSLSDDLFEAIKSALVRAPNDFRLNLLEE